MWFLQNSFCRWTTAQSVSEVNFWAESVCVATSQEGTSGQLFTSRSGKKDFQVEGEKWKLMELMGNKINTPPTPSREFPWDRQRWGEGTHLHQLQGKRNLAHLYRTISSFIFFLHNWHLLNPYPQMATSQWQLSMCTSEKQTWHSPRVGTACTELR